MIGMFVLALFSVACLVGCAWMLGKAEILKQETAEFLVQIAKRIADLRRLESCPRCDEFDDGEDLAGDHFDDVSIGADEEANR